MTTSSKRIIEALTKISIAINIGLYVLIGLNEINMASSLVEASYSATYAIGYYFGFMAVYFLIATLIHFSLLALNKYLTK